MAATSALFSLVQHELRDVEHELAATARPEDPFMGPLLSMVLPGQGKRMRPALALLCSKLGSAQPRPALDMAVGVELLHTASLVHDDVVDESATRRGEATLFTRVGNSLAVLVGDYLFAESAGRCVATGNLRVIGLFAATLGFMVQGQIREASGGSKAHLTLGRDGYYETVWGKTASLFVLACEGGALLAGLEEHQVLAMREYGRKIGLAFQVVDDILDYVGTEAELGKPVGGDLSQGIITLPLIYYRETQSAAAFDRLIRESSPAEVVARVRDSDAIARSYQDATDLVEGALAAVQAVPDSPVRETLDEIARLALRRTS